MKEQNWVLFKKITEKKFQKAKITQCWGFQIQQNTKWNHGLTIAQIQALEKLFDFQFPFDYVEMLKVLNGFETLEISIDPEGKEENEFARTCYKYPDDIPKIKWILDDINKNRQYINNELEIAGFDSKQIVGFIPLYGHRVLVALGNQKQSPVLSICGSDVILYGDSLLQYWLNEFHLLNFEPTKSKKT